MFFQRALFFFLPEPFVRRSLDLLFFCFPELQLWHCAVCGYRARQRHLVMPVVPRGGVANPDCPRCGAELMFPRYF